MYKWMTTVLIIVLCLHSGSQAANNESRTQFIIYFEGSNEITNDVTITIDHIDLIAEDYTTTLQPSATTFNSFSHANKQVLLVEDLVEPKRYLQLKIHLNFIEVIAERAKIYPDIDTAGYTVELFKDFSPGETAVLFLGWQSQNDYYKENTYKAVFTNNFKTTPPTGSVYFVSNEGSDNVSLIDSDEFRVVDVIRVGSNPREMVYSPLNNQVLVSNTGSNSISIIDASTNKVVKNILLDYSDRTIKMLLSPDNQFLYMLNDNSNTLTVFDLISMQEINRVYLDNSPQDMEIQERSGNIYITYEFSRELTVYNVQTNNIVTTYQLTYEAAYIATNNRNDEIYYSQPTQRSVSSFSSTDASAISTVNVCGYVFDMIYNKSIQTLYASVPECREILFIKPNQDIVLGSIETNNEPGKIAFDTRNNSLIIAYNNEDEIEIFNSHNRQSKAVIEVGQNPYMVLIP